MRTVFLSHHFGAQDRDLVDRVESLIESHGLRVIKGDALGGSEIDEGICKKIMMSDATVALMTHRDDEKAVGGTHKYVVDEYIFAVSQEKPAIRVVWPDVVLEGLYKSKEYIDYNPRDPVEAYLKLSKILGLWKIEVGKTLQAQILPQDVAEHLRALDIGECEYRLYDEFYDPGKWAVARLVPTGAGLMAIMKGVAEEHQFELKLDQGGEVWRSIVQPQNLYVSMEKKNE